MRARRSGESTTRPSAFKRCGVPKRCWSCASASRSASSISTSASADISRRSLGEGRNAEHIAQHDADVFAALEACQQRGGIGFKGARTHAGEALLEFFARVSAIELALAHESMKEIGIMDQGFAQPWTVAEDQHCVVNQGRMFLQQAQRLGGGRALPAARTD